MRYPSTAGQCSPATLARALRRGLAPDGGLYLPERLEPLDATFCEQLAGRDSAEVARHLARHLLADDLPAVVLDRLVDEALDFEMPLVQVDSGLHVLELFHGPTLAFKDVGARFLARLLEHTRSPNLPLTVLVATSGDTGGAVAQAFFGVPGTRVVVLYPQGQVSPVQERQFTTLGGNVRAIAVVGVFDDCQRLVKEIFADRQLHQRLGLTSANSINIGRLLPQIFYYFMAAAQLAASRPILFAVPSGNFGNLTAGLMARRLGLDCRFVAATNRNDVVPEYLRSGRYAPRPSLATISNAMDVGDPSNVARILHLYDRDLERLRRDVIGRAYDDQQTRDTIRRVDRDFGYVLDPHTAVGYRALAEVLGGEPAEVAGIVLATAHPAKFREVVEPVIGRPIPLPPRLAERLDLPVQSETMAADSGELARRLAEWE